MSAAAARRRKQLAARRAAQPQEQQEHQKDVDIVGAQLQKILSSSSADMDEAVAYEALQLAQSQVRKKISAGDSAGGLDLCFSVADTLLHQYQRVSVASPLLQLLADELRETHTPETEMWLTRLQELHTKRAAAMEAVSSGMPQKEVERLERVQRDWLLRVLQWSADIGPVKYGHNQLHAMLGEHCWKLSQLMETDQEHETMDDEEYISEMADLQCDAVQHMALAELPHTIVDWLVTLPEPTEEQRAVGHTVPPAVRDGLLTRAILLLCAMQNLRDANILLRGFLEKTSCTDEQLQALATSYTDKTDGKAPSHIIFNCMLLRILEKDTRTGPLYTWLLKSFRRSELERLHKAQAVLGYTVKIGKVYFNIQPPPNMLNMMENMMGGMMGGGGINPAMMQAAMAQMQQGGMM